MEFVYKDQENIASNLHKVKSNANVQKSDVPVLKRSVLGVINADNSKICPPYKNVSKCFTLQLNGNYYFKLTVCYYLQEVAQRNIQCKVQTRKVVTSFQIFEDDEKKSLDKKLEDKQSRKESPTKKFKNNINSVSFRLKCVNQCCLYKLSIKICL